MSVAASFMSRSTRGSRSKVATGTTQPKIEITLKDHLNLTSPSTQVTFSTSDKIEGTVTILAPTDTRFDNIEIALLGMTCIILYIFRCIADR